jgi:hypothetical protein
MSVDIEPVDVAQGPWHQTRIYDAAAHRNIAVSSPGSPAIELAKDGGIGSVRPADQ